MAGAVARRSKVANALPRHHRRWAGRAKPHVQTQAAGFIHRRISTPFISRLSCRLGTLSLLRRRGLALHLLLCILRRQFADVADRMFIALMKRRARQSINQVPPG